MKCILYLLIFYVMGVGSSLSLARTGERLVRAGEKEFEARLIFARNQHGVGASNCHSEMCSHLKTLIDDATASIDFAIYGIQDQPEILASLQRAQERGVQIRGVVDTENRHCGKLGIYNYPDTARLISALGGADVVHCDQGANYHYIMHNKFFIFDRRLVWTGSTNISKEGTGGENHANVTLTLYSRLLADRYKAHFDRLYAGKFHQRQFFHENPTISWLDGTQVKAYFAPLDDTFAEAIHPLVDHAKSSLYISMFFLTHRETADKIIDAHNRGVDVKVILDGMGGRHPTSQAAYLCQAGVKVKIEDWASKMHLKTAVTDSQIKREGVFILGSQNWTLNGNAHNDENTLYIKNHSLALQMEKEFFRLWDDLRHIPICAM